MTAAEEPDNRDLSAEALALLAFIEDRVFNTEKLFSETERSGLVHGHIATRSRSWAKPKLCSFRGCGKRSIARSHTIQRSGPLHLLAENSLVLTPRWTTDGMIMKALGLSQASTFPGFCDDHERLFDGFENKRAIETLPEAEMQIFRSLCREIASQKRDIKSGEDAIATVTAQLDKEIRAEAARLGVGFQSYAFEGGPIGHLRNTVAGNKAALSWLEAMYDDHFPSVSGTGQTAVVGEIAQIDLEVPVALSGFGNFPYNGVNVYALVGVIPQAKGTLIYMVGRAGSEAAITEYLRNKHLDLCLLDLVEAWMIRGSDHWFIRPSVWNAIPQVRQAQLLAMIHNGDHGIAVPPPLSIFDAMRRTALAVPAVPGMAQNLRDFVELQHAKLA